MVRGQTERPGGDRRRLLQDRFGERIPTDVQWFDGSDPQKMHNHYAYIYNELVWNVLKETRRREEEAVLFARSASVGAQQFPVHWGGDCYANYESMAGKPARRAVDWPVRLRFLEPRYRRVRKHRSGARLQTLVRVRAVLQPQPPARQQILPRAVGVR